MFQFSSHEDERHGPVGEAAVHEAGPGTPLLRVPLADHVDTGGVHQTGAGAAQHRVADERQEQVPGVRDGEIADAAADRAGEHRGTSGDDACTVITSVNAPTASWKLISGLVLA